MSREQADQVALAVDRQPLEFDGDDAELAKAIKFLKPIPGEKARWQTFYKNAIASGSIVPPIGESARVRNSDWWTGICAICFVLMGVAFFIGAMVWR